ncbi:4'-phosphopantetheinyl transferase superfamily protein [Actinopolymorpha sp. B17G11]|uniref:4'-phosphopantetheinyl transferase family protein n=1 Tax=Actinopolymorpha sp. B17G11 TaxID=3160861 RepID=UPI0032E3D338
MVEPTEQGPELTPARRAAGRAGDGCDVWCATLASLERRHTVLLDPVERTRRTAYRQRADADRFTLGRALVRIVVGGALRIPAAGVRLDSTCATCGEPHGKPRLLHEGAPGVSITHAGDRVLVAVSTAGSVGIDVESPGGSGGGGSGSSSTAGRDVSDLAAYVLTPGERAHLWQLPARRQHAAFLRYWTRKEALVKATGRGLAHDLRRIEVSAPDQPPRVLSSTDPDHPAEVFALADLCLPEGYVASVAVLASGRRPLDVRFHDADPLLRRWNTRPGEASTMPPCGLG